ncbi:hypothetical protein BDV28DRAFT_148317 [Aspergillus coremiiformis]|uniref:Invertebrate defensins family profile domain-containing protein n=1 Tax=Aspergillus coremiiformis TaxID=138285 RepID=A0A5N6Z7N4_9EURO|nr:hypothetical protein BDV28DRAFT_148317 [Aspergillus coremiiformis]
MKVALILAACATLAAAVVRESPTSFRATENVSLPQEIFSFSSNPDDSSVQAPCGGLVPAQCSRLCGQIGYRCWSCGPSTCICSNNC